MADVPGTLIPAAVVAVDGGNSDTPLD